MTIVVCQIGVKSTLLCQCCLSDWLNNNLYEVFSRISLLPTDFSFLLPCKLIEIVIFSKDSYRSAINLFFILKGRVYVDSIDSFLTHLLSSSEQWAIPWFVAVQTGWSIQPRHLKNWPEMQSGSTRTTLQEVRWSLDQNLDRKASPCLRQRDGQRWECTSMSALSTNPNRLRSFGIRLWHIWTSGVSSATSDSPKSQLMAKYALAYLDRDIGPTLAQTLKVFQMSFQPWIFNTSRSTLLYRSSNVLSYMKLDIHWALLMNTCDRKSSISLIPNWPLNILVVPPTTGQEQVPSWMFWHPFHPIRIEQQRVQTVLQSCATRKFNTSHIIHTRNRDTYTHMMFACVQLQTS